MDRLKKAVLYARFSSDNQRTESIDAQVRAMTKYCQEHGYLIIHKYVDEAKSATTDKRPAFQQMISDSDKKLFDIVLVHKLDRFARNRYDSAIYKNKLKKNNVKVYSVLENLNDSPESVMLEAMLEGMSEYYSKNLAREVKKGMTENALKCKHTGGRPPLGFSLDADKKLIVNEATAQIIRLIFKMYDTGFQYSYIISKLTELGYRTKDGNIFKKNSIYDILKNEKYAGVYSYNRVSSKNGDNKRNSHKLKPASEIIRVEGGCPAIIEPELFKRVAVRMANNRGKDGSYRVKEYYLVNGKVRCGICGKRMVASSRHSGRNKIKYATYRCDEPRVVCMNKEMNKGYLDNYLKALFDKQVFTRQFLAKFLKQINAVKKGYGNSKAKRQKKLSAKLQEVDEKLNNLIMAIEKGIVNELIYQQSDKLSEERNNILAEIEQLKYMPDTIDKESFDINAIISKYQSFTFGTVEYRNYVQRFIKEIVIYPYKVDVILQAGDGVFSSVNLRMVLEKEAIYKASKSQIRKSKGA